ncbi:hypothetical protein NDU88_002325 [Pleurodeles waltl]|uniref:Uncharacterized protein n=1 Tax=Pleurodeles waltl TaxID=8319 RepID=A0AAV7Q912_PLEWA|nr:hypothetical protein NDU88_002325 [Pleurodeles waltl]
MEGLAGRMAAVRNEHDSAKTNLQRLEEQMGAPAEAEWDFWVNVIEVVTLLEAKHERFENLRRGRPLCQEMALPSSEVHVLATVFALPLALAGIPLFRPDDARIIQKKSKHPLRFHGAHDEWTKRRISKSNAMFLSHWWALPSK